MLIQEIYSCGSGKLIQCSRIDAILSASCVSKYVSPSTLANMSKRVNDDNKSVT